MKKVEQIPIIEISSIGKIMALILICSPLGTILILNYSSVSLSWIGEALFTLYLAVPVVLCYAYYSEKVVQSKPGPNSSFYIDRYGKIKAQLWKKLPWLVSLVTVFLLTLLSVIAFVNSSYSKF